MSLSVNPGPPAPRGLRQARSGDRPWPGDQQAGERPEPALVLEVDLGEPMPDIDGGGLTRVWPMLRLGSEPIGDLLLRVPPSGLSGEDVGAAIAARIGARRRRRRRKPSDGGPVSWAGVDGQPRSRRRGSTSSL